MRVKMKIKIKLKLNLGLKAQMKPVLKATKGTEY